MLTGEVGFLGTHYESGKNRKGRYSEHNLKWIPKAEVLCVPNVWGVKNQDKSYIFGVLKRCI